MEAIWITLIIIAAIVAILIYAVVDTKKTINSPDITVSAYLERKFFVDYAGDDELEKNITILRYSSWITAKSLS